MTGEKLKYWKRILSHGHFSHKKKKRHGLVRKQTRASEVTGQKSTHRLIHGTALAVLSAVGPIFMKPVVLYQLDNAR